MRKGYVYSLICPKTFEIRYIGITIGKIQYRLAKHKKEASKQGQTHKINWLRSLQKENLLDNLQIKIIEEVNENILSLREQYWISHYRSIGLDLVNTAPGGSTGSLGYKHSSEAKQKISEAGKRNKGRKAAEETRRKISLSLIGSKRRLGKPFTKEAKKKISQSKLGTPAWNRKKIAQYTLSGELIKIWESTDAAQKHTQIRNISAVARGEKYRKQAGGFVWRYV